MAASPHAEAIQRLEETVRRLEDDVKKVSDSSLTLVGRANISEKDIDRIEAALAKMDDAIRSLDKSVQAIDKKLPLVEHQITNLQSGRTEWANRIWTAIFSLIAAVIGAGIIYYFGWKK